MRLSERELLLTRIAMLARCDVHYGTREEAESIGWRWTSHVAPNDLVRCVSQRTANQWCFAWLVSPRGGSAWLLRDLTTPKLCNMVNESLEAIVGIPSWLLLIGYQRRRYVTVRSALRRVARRDRLKARFADLIWPDRSARTATLLLRPHIWLSPRNDDERHTPMSVLITPDMRAAAIEAAIESTVPSADVWNERIERREEGR